MKVNKKESGKHKKCFIKVRNDDDDPVILSSDVILKIDLQSCAYDDYWGGEMHKVPYIGAVIYTNQGETYTVYAGEDWCMHSFDVYCFLDSIFDKLSNGESIDLEKLSEDFKNARLNLGF